MKKTKVLILIVTILFLLTACSKENEANSETEPDKGGLDNLNDAEMPIVKDQIKLDFFAGNSALSAGDWNDIMIWNEYRDMTNIDVAWNQIQPDSLEEKRNLLLASGDLPDVIYSANIPSLDLLKYGEQGTFIKLNDLIEEYAPNLKKIMEEDPNIKKSITFPDGNIYSLPTLHSPDFTALRALPTQWYNQEWLTALDMEVPETTEDYYQYLKAVKEQDPNGNGKPDEVPYGGGDINLLIGWLKGSFGLGNRGHSFIDMDPEENEMRFYPIIDEYKEMLEYVNKLYEEELIEQNIFSIEHEQFIANASEGLYGSLVYWSPEAAFNEAGKDFVSGKPLVGPHGEQLFSTVTNPVSSIGNFVITKNNEDPAATMRWADYFYSDEGAKFFYMGIEGETYEETSDGKYEYLDEIKNSKDGLTQTQELTKYLVWPGIGAPGIIKQDYFEGSENNPQSLEAAKTVEPYMIDEIWSNFTYTKEENNDLSALSADIEKYVDEMMGKFITGNIPFSEWDKYVDTIKKMGLEDYMEIQRSAYERYDSQ